MDKHTQVLLEWAFLMICSLLGLGSLAKAWINGEINRGRTGSFKFTELRREDDSSKFALYLIGLLIMNVSFFLALVIWGLVMFW